MSTEIALPLVVPARLSWDQWVSCVHEAARIKEKLPFFVGDLILYGESTFGEKAWQIIEEFGYSERTLTNYKSIAKKFPPDERFDLPFSWHAAAAALPKRERLKVLESAKETGITRAGIRALSPNGKVHQQQTNPLIDAWLLVGKLLSREADGDDVAELLAPALDSLIAEAMGKLARITRKTGGGEKSDVRAGE